MSYTISGSVGVVGASVRLSPTHVGSSVQTQSIIAGTSGNYEFDNVAVGDYVVSASASGYTYKSKSVTVGGSASYVTAKAAGVSGSPQGSGDGYIESSSASNLIVNLLPVAV